MGAMEMLKFHVVLTFDGISAVASDWFPRTVAPPEVSKPSCE
jgi:hypothetical protein